MLDASNSFIDERQILADRTNTSTTSPFSTGKRLAEENEATSKRVKCVASGISNADDKQEFPEIGMNKSNEPIVPRSRFQSVYGRLQALKSGNPSASRSFTLPTTNILGSFVSSDRTDLYKCYSQNSSFYLTPPYACAYSNASKRGREYILAVATEEGTLNLLNTNRRNEWDSEPARTVIQVHNNGIFDVKWAPSDARIATASGDRSICITDLGSSTSRTLHVLNGGHQGTAKCVAWDPMRDDVVVSGGRDGRICLWDLRTDGREQDEEDRPPGHRYPVLTIPYAHEANAGKPTKNGRSVLAPKSVTSLIYLPDSTYEIISGGSGDGILRKWDLRSDLKPSRKRSKKSCPLLCDYSAEDLTTVQHVEPSAGTVYSPRRARGIVSLALGSGPSAGRIFALSNDSRVHTYNALGASGVPLGVLQPDQPYTHRHMATNSFYIRAAVSPCGRWLASGGADGSAFLFDVADRASEARLKGVELNGQKGEVSSVDWADGLLATCADDGTVRTWRPDIERHRHCTQDPEEAKWHWSWARL